METTSSQGPKTLIEGSEPKLTSAVKKDVEFVDCYSSIEHFKQFRERQQVKGILYPQDGKMKIW